MIEAKIRKEIHTHIWIKFNRKSLPYSKNFRFEPKYFWIINEDFYHLLCSDLNFVLINCATIIFCFFQSPEIMPLMNLQQGMREGGGSMPMPEYPGGAPQRRIGGFAG